MIYTPRPTCKYDERDWCRDPVTCAVRGCVHPDNKERTMPSPSLMAMEEEAALPKSRIDPLVQQYLDSLPDTHRAPPGLGQIRGWQCPVCGAGVAPHVTVCPCKQPIRPLPPIERDVWVSPPPYKALWLVDPASMPTYGSEH